MARGAVVPLEVVARLAARWYAGRDSESWSPRSPAESEALFREVGLEGAFWRLEGA